MQVLFCALFSLVLVDLPTYLLACNGYEYKTHYFKPCSDEAEKNNVIKFTNADTKLDSDCNIIPIGCMKTDGFKAATVHYRVEKKPMPILEGDFDICKGLETKDEFALLGAKLLALPDTCPVGPIDGCADGKKSANNISKYKNKLGLAVGVTIVNLTITHDVGETCLTMKSEFKKIRKLG